MESLTLQIEQLTNKVNPNKQKKQKKSPVSFLDLLKQNERPKKVELNKNSQKADFRSDNPEKQENKKNQEVSKLDQIVILGYNTEKINSKVKTLSKKDADGKNRSQTDKSTALEVKREIINENRQDGIKIAQTDKQKKDTTTQELRFNIDKTLPLTFNQSHESRKPVFENVEENLPRKTESILSYPKPDNVFVEKKGNNINTQNIQLAEEKTKKEVKISDQFNVNLSENSRNQPVKKFLNKESDQNRQPYLNHIKHPENKNQRENIDTKFEKPENVQNIETVKFNPPVESINTLHEIRQTNQQLSQNTKINPDTQNPPQLVLFNSDSFSGNGQQSDVDFRFDQQGSGQETMADKNIPTTKFSVSFNFLDTKVNIQAGLNNIVMYINTAQTVDPLTAERIRQILTDNGFLNHNLVIRDRSKTLKLYTNDKNFIENRNGDGFKISA